MEFSRPEYWSEQPLPSPGDLPKPGIEPRSPALQGDSLSTELREALLFSGGLVTESCPTLAAQPHGLYPTRLLCPWDSPGKNTGMGCHFLLQGIFPTQELNLGLLHCRQIL